MNKLGITVLLLVISSTVQATQLQQPKKEHSSWAGSKYTVSISEDGEEVVLNGQRYPVGEEIITERSTVSSAGWFETSGTECKIVTRSATRHENQIVLVKSVRSSVVGWLGAISCRFTQSTEGFSSPFAFDQFVLTPGSDGQDIVLYGISVTDSLDRPDLSPDELTNPELTFGLRTSRTEVHYDRLNPTSN